MRARLFGPFFVFAGVMHFVAPRWYAAIVPDWLPGSRRAVVYASGVAEIAGGMAILHRRTRRLGSLWSIATLLAVFPCERAHGAEPPALPRSGRSPRALRAPAGAGAVRRVGARGRSRRLTSAIQSIDLGGRS